MQDQIERWEAVAERSYDEKIQPDGGFKCACGYIFDPEKEGGILSPNPYAMPACQQCCDDYFKHAKQG